MTIPPNDFRDLLDSSLADEPPAPPFERDLGAGRSRLRRRRLATGAVSVLAVGALAGSAYSLGAGASDNQRGQDTTVAAPPDGAAEYLDKCRNGENSDKAVTAMFGAGAPTIEASTRTEHQVTLALLAADGKHWAECWINLQAQEFSSGMTVHAANGRSTQLGSSFGTGCGLVDGELDSNCSRFTATWVDRLPEQVAAVEFRTGDGESTVVRSKNGFVVFEYLGTLPAGASSDPSTWMEDFHPVTRITYLDASGAPLAADAMDGSGSGEERNRVGSLPTLKKYPSLRTDDEIH